jgi:alpha-L-rhamnosidase
MARFSSFLILSLAASAIASADDLSDLRRGFEHPPDDARIMMRWWWFGPAVTKPELEREMRAMKEGGIGGFEVQPVYPLALDDPEHGFRNMPYLSDEYLDTLTFVSRTAHDLGLRMDVTLGSGWPFGGPHTPITEAAGRLRCERLKVAVGQLSAPLPDITAGEKLLAAFLAEGDGKQFSPNGLRRVTDFERGRARLPRDLSGSHVLLFFIASRTGQMVKRAAIGAEGFVLDHYDRAAIDHHLQFVGDRLMEALKANPPYAVFSDSLEVFGSEWTGDMLEQFRKRRGYDLTPYLPALVGDMGEKTAAVRNDWGKTLTELADERYLAPLREWAQRRGTRFRSQTYGTPPVALSSNALVDLPEGEGPHWRRFSASRWAASANHLYGKPVTSSETWTWLHSPAFRATPLDMKAEADLHFLQGINQLVGHGWPYSPDMAGNPGWRFYAAAVFNDQNPWWPVMPDITRYL